MIDTEIAARAVEEYYRFEPVPEIFLGPRERLYGIIRYAIAKATRPLELRIKQLELEHESQSYAPP